MVLRVDLLPESPYEDVVVVVDVLRSNTVAAVLFENDLAQLHVTQSIKVARKRAAQQDALLIGARDGLPPEGFNYGNSVAELRKVELQAKHAVMVSENLALTLAQVAEAEHALLGSLFNARAVVTEALERAKRQITFVCAGFRGEEDLDDAFCAGVLCTLARMQTDEVTLQGAARLTMSLLKAFPDPLEALWQSVSGQHLRRLDLVDDLAGASLLSQTDMVPRLKTVDENDASPIYVFEAV